ncbi:acetyltransferase [Streptomyces sp. AcH 505]|uniref:GNAT family N-acetyltransferase n=1 Tax=unclassified Streptomyces TaxID=2593676 RepID=UPI000591F404|nr:GNAT family protein [Streptomyces sp. NBC_00370]KIF71149.1 acetyltransferase [Streptomyces sp. AcH 505]
MPETTTQLGAGPRAVIRPYRSEDAEEFTALARESKALHHPWLFPPDDAEAFATYVSRFTGPSGAGGPAGVGGAAGYLVCSRSDGRIAGYVNVNNIVRGAFRSGAIGYGAFAHAAGQGLMSEGLALVMRHAFGPLGLHRLEANIQPANTRSIAFVRRAGFRLEGYSPDFLYIHGAWRDHERWAVTAGPQSA